MHIILVILQLLFYTSSVVKSQAIQFPTDDTVSNGCDHTSGKAGLCKIMTSCHVKQTIQELRTNNCGYEGNTPKICCPKKEEFIEDNVRTPHLDFQCGLKPTKNNDLRFKRGFKSQPTVVGGIVAEVNQWPWAALVGRRDNTSDRSWLCTGSLINTKFVLSAAHCVNDVSRTPNIIRLGEHDFNDPHDGTLFTEIDIETLIVNPDYTIRPSYHDLVIFEMIDEVILNSARIIPICLPWNNVDEINLIDRKMTIIGWGATEFEGDVSSVLREAQIQSFDASICDNSYKDTLQYPLDWPQGITNELYICAGNKTDSVDACTGDSGGPLMYVHKSKYILEGVTSKGYGCGNINFQGLYINLRNERYLKWIKKVAFQKFKSFTIKSLKIN